MSPWTLIPARFGIEPPRWAYPRWRASGTAAGQLPAAVRGAKPVSEPTGPAGGDLEGSEYPNPIIAALKVTTGKIAALAVTAAQLAEGAVTAPKLDALRQTAAYAAAVKRKTGEEWKPSVSRWSFVSVQVSEVTTTATEVVLEIGGVVAMKAKYKLIAGEALSMGVFPVPPNAAVKLTFTEANLSIETRDFT